MAQRRRKNESFENMARVMPEGSAAALDVTMANACVESAETQAYVDNVKSKLETQAQNISQEEEKPEEKNPVENTFTATLKLDESIEDFNLQDGRSRKVYEDEDEDPYLDYDMFDFIYGLVTDCWPKPINPLSHRIRKFRYIGSDSYTGDEEDVDKNQFNQVATYGDSIEVYADQTEAFNDIIEICNLYKFHFEGPVEKKSAARHWNYSFIIDVPTAANGYPQMVEDYFESIGKTLEDVMPNDFCQQYRKRMAKLQQTAEKMLAEKEVDKIVSDAIRDAARDNEPLKTHLDRLFSKLDIAKLPYKRTAVKKTFMDAFDDDYDE